MTTPVFTSKNQSDGVKMDMTTPVLTTKVLWFFFMNFVNYLSCSLYLFIFIWISCKVTSIYLLYFIYLFIRNSFHQ